MPASPNLNILWTATDFALPQELWKTLEGMGYKVLITETDTDIPNQLKTLSPRLWVGSLNGDKDLNFSHLKEIKTSFPKLSIILVSNQPNTEDVVTAIKLGVSDYLPGNISSDRLWLAIEGALNLPCPMPLSQPQRGKIKRLDQPIAVHHTMVKILNFAKKIAPSRSTVLINGETGVGKEVIARYIHNHSDRKDGAFIAVNCAALPENLLESELFGHERGAFTGAISRKKGKFELANGGTLLLDEISEMDISIQAKLLRVLQEKEIDRVGGQSTIPVDVRIIATTNRDLETETKNGTFRLDLYYRLNVVPLSIPPMRERPDDISPLANYLFKKHCALNNVPLKTLSSDAEDYLKKRAWPGNVREFENLIERSTLLVDTDMVKTEDLELISSPETGTENEYMEKGNLVSLKAMEKKMIFRALDNNSGNRTHAAKVLGISVRTLRNKLNEYKNEI